MNLKNLKALNKKQGYANAYPFLLLKKNTANVILDFFKRMSGSC